jgi:hypothetical protein
MSEPEDVREESQELIIPAGQQTLSFYGKPILVVRLPDGRPAIVLRSFCENMQIDTNGQVKRIRRTEAIADDLINGVRIERPAEEGGPQAMAALVLRAVPFWLAGIDPKRVREEIRSDILRYQREVVDVLYAWAQTLIPTTISATTEGQTSELVPAEPITTPTRPEQGAGLEEWREYYLRMAAVIEWQMDVEQWRGSIESRLEGVEAIVGVIPEILDRLGPETINTQHQHQIQTFVKRLHEVTGKTYGTIYDDLRHAFNKPRYQELLEAEWPQVERWFLTRIEKAKKPK